MNSHSVNKTSQKEHESQDLPSCSLYHPLSELKLKSGYYPNISLDQIECVRKVLLLIEQEELNFNTDNEVEFLKILRFLRARKFNVDQAMHMIRSDIKWRSEENRLSLRNLTAFEVLECDLSQVYKYFPTWIQGYDKQSRPISWRKFGKFEIWNILKLTSMKQMINFHAWESEQLLRLMHEKSLETGYNIETFTVIIDASGWAISQATSDAFTFIKGMASTDGDHYPERLGTLIVINAPFMLSYAWKIIQGFLDDVQKAKIGIYGTNPDEWRPVLFQIIDKGQVPVQYGGTLPDLDPEDALSSMNPPELMKTIKLPPIQITKPNSSPLKGPDISTSKNYQEEKYDNVIENKKSLVDNDDTRFCTTANTPITSPKKASWFGFFDSSHSNEFNNDKELKPILVDNNICESSDIYSPDAEKIYHTSQSAGSRRKGDPQNAGNQTNNCIEEISHSKLSLINPYSNIPHSSSTPGGVGYDHTTLAVSPLKSPMRLVSPNKGKWNIDASTQTEDPLELSGEERKANLMSKKCVCCTIL